MLLTVSSNLGIALNSFFHIAGISSIHEAGFNVETANNSLEVTVRACTSAEMITVISVTDDQNTQVLIDRLV